MPLVPQLDSSQVLLVTAALNGIFCVSQGIASHLSHSLALLGDSIDMAADTVTYGLAFWIERRKEQGAGHLSLTYRWIELVVAMLSGLSLVIGSLVIIDESVSRHAGGEEEEEDVNQVIIFVFATANLIVNGLQLSLFLSRKGGDEASEIACCNPMSPLDAPVPEEAPTHPVGGQRYEQVGAMDVSAEVPLREGDSSAGVQGAGEDRGCCGSQCRNINVGASLAHVGADTMRTFSELAAAFIIQVFKTDSVQTDAVAAIVINLTILASGLYICYEVVTRAPVLWRASRQRSDGDMLELSAIA